MVTQPQEHTSAQDAQYITADEAQRIYNDLAATPEPATAAPAAPPPEQATPPRLNETQVAASQEQHPQQHPQPEQLHQPEPPTRRVRSRSRHPQQITEIRQRQGQQGQRRRRRTVPNGESREQKFSRLATVRTRRAIRAIMQLQNLAAPTYAFNEDQVEHIDHAIEEAMDGVRGSFRRRLHGGRRRVRDEAEAFVV